VINISPLEDCGATTGAISWDINGCVCLFFILSTRLSILLNASNNYTVATGYCGLSPPTPPHITFLHRNVAVLLPDCAYSPWLNAASPYQQDSTCSSSRLHTRPRERTTSATRPSLLLGCVVACSLWASKRRCLGRFTALRLRCCCNLLLGPSIGAGVTRRLPDDSCSTSCLCFTTHTVTHSVTTTRASNTHSTYLGVVGSLGGGDLLDSVDEHGCDTADVI